MPYKDVTYDNGFTERFYYDETDDEQALRMSRMNSVAKFPSANHRAETPKTSPKRTDSNRSDSWEYYSWHRYRA